MKNAISLSTYFTAAAVTLITFSACSDKDPAVPVLNDANATTEVATIVVPPNGEVFYDFNTNSVQDSATSMISLSGTYGSALENSRPNVYQMGYFDQEDTSVEDLVLADILGADFKAANSLTIDASSAGAPAMGPTWVIYDHHNNHAVYPTPDRYIVLYKGATLDKHADELYVMQATTIGAAQGTATYSMTFKKFIKE